MGAAVSNISSSAIAFVGNDDVFMMIVMRIVLDPWLVHNDDNGC